MLILYNGAMKCVVCNKILSGRKRKFCSISCKNSYFQSYASQKRRGLQRKQEIVGRFGGECSVCGYKKNLAALSFHHLRDKKFKLDVRSLSNRKTKKIEGELTKCQLLCQNCHAEIHNPDLAL